MIKSLIVKPKINIDSCQHAPPMRGKRYCAGIGMLAVVLILSSALKAYPPAPHHQFYGNVRDEFGTPIIAKDAVVFLETAAGVQFRTNLDPGFEPGANYKLSVPMDSGISADLYKPTALRPQVPFLIKVVIAGVTNLPIQMSVGESYLGAPGERTKIDLTLGIDSDGDGLPDAWERLINPDISKVNPHDDSDDDGMGNLAEYLAGTYAFDPENGFSLEIVRFNSGRPVLEFVAIQGRTYFIQGSRNLLVWRPLRFQVLAEAGDSPSRTSHTATDVRKVQVEVELPSDLPPRFFRLIAQ
jgi:hypothetical protein